MNDIIINQVSGMHASSATIEVELPVLKESVKLPDVPKETLADLAKSKGAAGVSDSVTLLSSAFMALNGKYLSGLERGQSTLKDNIQGETQKIERLSQELTGMSRYKQQKNADGTPWSLFDIGKAAVLMLLSFGALGIDYNSEVGVLKESGVAFFQDGNNAYFFSIIPLLLAIGLKLYRYKIKDLGQQDVYCKRLLQAGIGLAVLWIMLFAVAFNGIGSSQSEILDSLHNKPSALVSFLHGLGVIVFLGAGLVGSACLAAALWNEVEDIVRSHHGYTRTIDPDYTKLESEIENLVNVRAKHRGILDEIAGRINELDHKRKEFIAKGESFFWKVAKA